MGRLPASVSRHAIALITGLCGPATLVPAAAQTAAWPTRPVRLMMAFTAGGPADVMARSVQQLGEALGQALVIENRGGNEAGTEVARNDGDGHTFLITTSTTVNPSIFARMPFDPQKDLQPWPCSQQPALPNHAHHAGGPQFQGLHRPRRGSSTTPQLAGELRKQSAGITATHLPHRGAVPVIQAVMTGQIDFSASRPARDSPPSLLQVDGLSRGLHAARGLPREGGRRGP